MNATNLKSAATATATETPQASLIPMLMLALPAATSLARRLSWRMLGFGVVAVAAGYLVHSFTAGGRKSPPRSGKVLQEDLNRWEDEGGMVATSAPAKGPVARSRWQGGVESIASSLKPNGHDSGRFQNGDAVS